MSDICRFNLSQCLNNGQCVLNISSNTTYCQCDTCYEGILCETAITKQTQFDTAYVYLIIYITGLCFSILNNCLSLELFIGCKRIRQTNCGTYLISYCILSLVSNILLVANEAVAYYPNQLMNNPSQYDVFHCYVSKIGYNMLVYLCIWFSSCVALERSLVIRFDRKMTANRWLSLVTTIFIFAVAGGSAAPLLLYKCDWDNIPGLEIARGFFIWFYISTGITIYVLATLLVLISFSHRISRYGTDNGSRKKTFCKLLYKHLFIFVPPIAYIIVYIPYTIVYSKKNPNDLYFQCGISTGEYIIKVLIDILQGVPFVITWLLFVFPSKVYMTEFYLETWSGKCLAKIISLFKSYFNRKKTAHPPTTNLTDNEHDNV
jgi:hypothetical protein